MNVVNQISRWLGRNRLTIKPKHDATREFIDAGQRAKRAERYEVALNLFEQALFRAEQTADTEAAAVVNLHRAEIFIRTERWEQAESLLLQMRRHAQSDGQPTQMGYALNTLGTLAQARGDWAEARAYYEQALRVSQSAGSMGAEARALGHLADTYLHEANASYAAHLLRDSVPRLNMSGDLEPSSYFVGRLGEALILTGQDSEGERLLYRALRLAEQMKHVFYERHWTLALGQRMMDSLRYEDAHRFYQRALELMPDERHQPQKIIALAQLSRVHLYMQDGESALKLAEEAMQAAEGLADAGLLTLAESALGMALRYTGHSAQAITHLDRALAALDDPQTELLRNLAAAQADTADTEAAIRTYQRALAHTDATDPVGRAQTLVDVGLLYAGQRNMQAALDHWTQALAIYTNERQFGHVARLHCDIGSARKFLGQGPRALKEYEQALTTLNSVDDWITRGTVLSNAAIAYADVGEIESAEAFFNEAITIATRTGQTQAEAVRRGNYGWFLLATSRAHQAVTVLEYALRLSQRQQHTLSIATQTSNLALAHDALGNVAAALTYHEQAHALLPNVPDPHWVAMIQINLAQAFMQRGRLDEASVLLDTALAAGQRISDVEVIISATTQRARLALLLGEADRIGDSLSEIITLARRADMRRLLAGALRLHSEQQAALGNQEQAHSLWEEAHRLLAVLHAPEAQQRPDWLVTPV